MSDPIEPAAPVTPPSGAHAADRAPVRRSTIVLIAVVALLVVAIAVVVVLLLTRGGASPDAAGTPSATPTGAAPTATPTPTATSTPTAPPAPAAFVMPTCSAMAVPDIPPRVEAGDYVEITRDGEQATMAEAMPGPVAAEAVLASPQARMCAWGPPNSDGGAHVWVVEMDQARWDALAGELASSGWTAIDVDGAPGFTQVTGEPAMDGPAEWWYVHTDGAWIIYPFASSPEVRSAAVAGVQGSNR